MKISNIMKFIVAVAFAEFGGVIGSLATISNVTGWYAGLKKPALNPPDWVFGPVWTMLYLIMGIALFLVWRRGAERGEVRIALGAFVLQLALNAAWSVIFFKLQSPGYAFAELIVLWVAILWTIGAFYKVSKPAAFLLAPYILWVSFAGYLNYSIWKLSASEPQRAACTAEAMLCPDGSAVGRTGPNCEFAPCPGTAQ